MKKIIFGLITALLISITCVVAFTMPHPVYGTIKNNDVMQQNVQVKYENLKSGVVSYINTDNRGFYQFELANIDSAYRSGDSVRISIVSCSGTPACVNNFVLGDGGDKIDFNLNGASVESECPSCPVCEQTTCPDCICTPTQCEEVICPSCEECEVCEECPEQTDVSFLYQVIFGLAGLVLGGLSWYAGFKGLVAHYIKKGKEAEASGNKKLATEYYNRAAKMINTAVQRVKSEQQK